MNKELSTLDQYLTNQKADRSPEIKAFDWQGEPLYSGETVYSIENEYVREDDLKAFIENSVGKPVEI
ncbi:hypothetical protein DQ181_06095 [Enterococcus faecium]|uniref:hypothetical protein n=1 Tax=Enterococcus faecium TaxID=1352 RepID=UPI000A34C2C7|nr:hypothetical protein [Enterococcus faecium]EGP5708710.1 hypothetical protein [Enterococcus faecium]OTO54135.1 hypothetical protein A5814_002257 [Enterococcus faecium]